MTESTPSSRALRLALRIAGALAILGGIATIVLGSVFVIPRADSMASVFREGAGLGRLGLQMAGSAYELAEIGPEAIREARQTLAQSARTVELTGSTLDEVTGGIQDVVLPEGEIGANAQEAKKLGQELRDLERLTSRFQKPVSELGPVAAESRDVLNRLGPEVIAMGESLGSLPMVPLLIVLVLALGGAPILLGLMALAAANLLERPRQAQSASSDRDHRQAA